MSPYKKGRTRKGWRRGENGKNGQPKLCYLHGVCGWEFHIRFCVHSVPLLPLCLLLCKSTFTGCLVAWPLHYPELHTDVLHWVNDRHWENSKMCHCPLSVRDAMPRSFQTWNSTTKVFFWCMYQPAVCVVTWSLTTNSTQFHSTFSGRIGTLRQSVCNLPTVHDYLICSTICKHFKCKNCNCKWSLVVPVFFAASWLVWAELHSLATIVEKKKKSSLCLD